MSNRKKILQAVHRSHGLTPLQRIVLDAFADGRSQDRVTVAVHLDGGSSGLTGYASLKVVADDVLGQLVAIGLVEVDSVGWHRLANNPPLTSTGHDATSEPFA